MFDLFEQDMLFERLISCIISIRTLDGNDHACVAEVFGVARTPAGVAALTPDMAGPLLYGTSYPTRSLYHHWWYCPTAI